MTIWEVIEKAATSGCTVEIEQDGMVVRIRGSEKPTEPKKPKPKPVPVERKKLDHGKILALSEAGWSVAKIADEMGCSEQSVRNHLEKG